MGLRTPFLLIFVAELVVFGLLCDAIGFWPTLLALIATSAAGALLLRAQGVTTLTRIQLMLEQGQSPVLEIVEALWLAAAGLLLLVPGFLTTLAALTLLLPITRRLVGVWLIGRYRAYAGGPIYVHAGFESAEPPPAAPPSPVGTIAGTTTTVIDVEFEDLPPKP
ncbi:MAG: FxsA family protein [Rhodospirillaceae bacterium]